MVTLSQWQSSATIHYSVIDQVNSFATDTQ